MVDVARVTGVSTATVSRVLAGIHGATSPATAAAVRKAARDLGYVMNGLAAGLRSQKTRTVGLVLADVSNPFFGQLTSGVESTLSSAGYGVVLVNTNNAADEERRLVHLLIEKQVDALIVAPSVVSSDHIERAMQLGLKVVLVDSDLPDLAVDCVVIDNAAIADKVTSYLVELGHSRIGIVTGNLAAAFDRARLEGYRQALDRHGIPADDALQICGDLNFDGGRMAVGELLKLPEPPSAIFATNNLMTVGSLVAITEAGLSAPDDISLVGFDDLEWYRIVRPPITTVRQPAYEMGRAAAGRLLELLARKGAVKPKKQVLEADLIVRGSAGRVREAAP
ncbi:MAG: LacI family DNA-binding transcriptional regulator [Rhizobiales bacterium]|nr:LacI family DNA-binding transcriptional regulator [Hyphomicrobiales bacterium]